MVSQKRLKGHGVKKEEGVSRSTKIASLLLLFVMVMSIGGFALSGNHGSTSTSSDGNKITLPLTEGAFQNSQTGERYWGAYVNGEQFVFINGIDGYDGYQNIANVADWIKTKNLVKVYVDEGFESSDALFMIEEKLFNAFEIESFRTNESSCDGETLIVTNGGDFGDGCVVFEAPKGEEGAFADILAYHLLK